MKTKIYEERGWIKGAQLEGGNQGHTFLARRQDDPEDEFRYVLKKLKRQDDPGRRRRFHIEVSSLEALDHPRIAQLAESNARDFRDEVELYLVVERICGIDLEKRVSETSVEPHIAARIVIRVLRTLDFCHENRVLHRDIKPCHIILRDCMDDDPVLIDFGLAFNEELEVSGVETATHEGVGNRFIVLAEQMAGGDKRDSRSDITQCVGVLFYLITKHVPGIIQSQDGQKPSEQVDLANCLSNLDSWRLARFRQIFDTGFEWDPRQRWQSCQSLISELEPLTDPTSTEPPVKDFESRLETLKNRLCDTPEQKVFARVVELMQICNDAASTATNQINNELDEVVMVSFGGGGFGYQPQFLGTAKQENRMTIILQQKRSLNEQTNLEISVTADNTEFVLSASYNTNPWEPVRMGLFDPNAEERITETIETFILNAVETLCS